MVPMSPPLDLRGLRGLLLLLLLLLCLLDPVGVWFFLFSWRLADFLDGLVFGACVSAFVTSSNLASVLVSP